MYGELIGLLGMILLLVPSSIFFILYIVFYRFGQRYNRKSIVELHNELVSIIIPIRKEPIEILDDAFKHVSKWSNSNYEFIVVSDDPPDNLENVKKVVHEWRRRGLNIIFVWRSEPRGFRTGALNTGLWLSRGKYIYVMDVDSRVSESFILKAASLIKKEGAVAVVARWTGKNKDSRVAEAISYSMKFIVDALYRGRSSLGLPVFPVGTGTVYDAVYLKSVLGGWDEDRIQDDMEIGCRIMRRGGKILFLDEEPVYVEVPRTYRSFRIQQERWSYGATDVAISRFWDIVRSPQPWYAKLEAFNFLLQYLPAMLGLIGFLLLTIGVFVSGIDFYRVYWWLGVPWLMAAALYVRYYIRSVRESGLDTWRCLVNLGRSSAITVSLTPTITAAILRAFLRRPFVYKRTPKGAHEKILHGYRIPWEFLVGAFIFVVGLYEALSSRVYTGLWSITYSLGYIYSTYRFFSDIIHE